MCTDLVPGYFAPPQSTAVVIVAPLVGAVSGPPVRRDRDFMMRGTFVPFRSPGQLAALGFHLTRSGGDLLRYCVHTSAGGAIRRVVLRSGIGTAC